MHTDRDTAPRRASAAHIEAPARKPPPPPASISPVQPREKVSAARLTVPKRGRRGRPPSAPTECRPPREGRETAALFDRLRALRDSLPPNKNSRAVVLIKACIIGGICTGSAIVSALVHLGFDNMHAGGTLHRHTLGKRSAAYWSKGEDGRYRVLD